MKETLNHHERVRLALAHQLTDRVPIAMVCAGLNPPVRLAFDSLLRRTRGIGVDDYLNPLLDIRVVCPAYKGPTRKPGEDHWGVIRSPMSYGVGEYQEISHYPLRQVTSLDELARHPWPQTAWFDYAVIPQLIAQADADGGPYCMMSLNFNVFESAWYMRGFEQAFSDMADESEIIVEILQRVTDFLVDHVRRTLEAGRGRIDLIFTADDIGGQNGMLMSLDMWRKFIFPHHVRINRVIHELGAKVIYHTDGAVMPAVPGLVEMGIDILQALQFDADGMDPVALKRDFGHQLCFEGGVSVQKTLPFGTVEQVRTETLDRIRVLGKGGGYILGPSHAVQAGTPPENVLAMFETARTASLTS